MGELHYAKYTRSTMHIHIPVSSLCVSAVTANVTIGTYPFCTAIGDLSLLHRHRGLNPFAPPAPFPVGEGALLSRGSKGNRRDSNSPPDVAAVHCQCACYVTITPTASKITHMGCKGRLIRPNHHSTKMENAAIYITVSASLQLSFHAASSHDQRRH
jgi:hypothetical protein